MSFNRITIASRLTVLLLGIALLWGTIQTVEALFQNNWLGALSAILVSVMLVLVALKLDSIGRLAQKNSNRRNKAKQPGSTDETKTSAKSHRANHFPIGPRLDAIGLFVPEVVDTKAKGRQAAAVNEDPHRAHRLYAALFGLANRTHILQRETTGRHLAVIATERLVNALHSTDIYTVEHLHPGYANAQIHAQLPSAIVLEEAAFTESPWATTLEATGTSLLLELLNILDSATKMGTNIYVLKDNKKHLAAASLRSKASITLPLNDLNGSHPGDRPAGRLIAVLDKYAQGTK